jgi:hypothetical protein
MSLQEKARVDLWIRFKRVLVSSISSSLLPFSLAFYFFSYLIVVLATFYLYEKNSFRFSLTFIHTGTSRSQILTSQRRWFKAGSKD